MGLESGAIGAIPAAALITLYGCGPNLVVGIPALCVVGGMSIYDVFKRNALKDKKQEAKEDEKPEIKRQIKEVKRSLAANEITLEKIGWSLIPIAGPWIAVLREPRRA